MTMTTPKPKCDYCNDWGHTWVADKDENGEDTGHDYQVDCPYCNPTIDLYASEKMDYLFDLEESRERWRNYDR